MTNDICTIVEFESCNIYECKIFKLRLLKIYVYIKSEMRIKLQMVVSF